jgi:hypothetical protein
MHAQISRRAVERKALEQQAWEASEDAKALGCPHCGARPGQPCRRPPRDGSTTNAILRRTHKARQERLREREGA